MSRARRLAVVLLLNLALVAALVITGALFSAATPVTTTAAKT